jgi:hypothetical protein
MDYKLIKIKGYKSVIGPNRATDVNKLYSLLDNKNKSYNKNETMIVYSNNESQLIDKSKILDLIDDVNLNMIELGKIIEKIDIIVNEHKSKKSKKHKENDIE